MYPVTVPKQHLSVVLPCCLVPQPALLCCWLQVVIHPAIPPASADKMTEEAYKAIASSLPPELVAPLDEEDQKQ